jgi:hypothetical protein
MYSVNSPVAHTRNIRSSENIKITTNRICSVAKLEEGQFLKDELTSKASHVIKKEAEKF